MNQILTLIIPSGWPQETRACPWQLHAADDRLLAQGCAEPGQWPAAGEDDRCRLLLAGRQVAAQPARLPPPPQAMTTVSCSARYLMVPSSSTLRGWGEQTTRRQPRPASSTMCQPSVSR